ncbi:MAG: hypothetical protein EZS28_038990 [Streblomastix strix]|uniref:Uncharacterized protein n=1 Tax=Streblomastix strix TaxID=222440 RepID=A0A5J4U5F4_9EUKA|nr:MAG: hypothetical protein EZS28_038990 [Streblomastix strix]
MNIRMSEEKKVENDAGFEALMQRNIQEEWRKDKITSSADGQIKFFQSFDKRSVSVSNGIRQSEDTSIEDMIMERNNDSKQSSNQRIEKMDKENNGQLTRVIEQQNNNMHANNRRIAIGLGQR